MTRRNLAPTAVSSKDEALASPDDHVNGKYTPLWSRGVEVSGETRYVS
jgi:hypothetical protein